jgi:cytochrome c556
MKIITAAIISLLLAGSLFASSTVDQSKLASDMRTMLNAITDIQRAGFYNNKAGIKDATQKLVSNLDSLLEADASKYLPDNQVNAGKFAKKRVKMIKMYAQDLVDSIDHNDFDDAIEDYSQLLRQCTSCHSRIRHKAWE